MIRRITLLFLLSTQTQLGYCALINLSQSPLFLGSNVPPNVIFSLDDAGTMDYEFITDPYWEQCAYDPNTTGVFSNVTSCGSNIDNDGMFYAYDSSLNKYHYFSYYYSNTDNTYNPNCNQNNDQSAIENCNIANTIDWRAYTSNINQIYYNPSNDYLPWQGPCFSNGSLCTNASFTAARSYPADALPGYSVLKNLAGSKYEIWIDDKGYSGARPLRGTSLNATNTPNNQVDFWDSHVTVVLGNADVKVYKTEYSPNALSVNPIQTLMATLTDANTCYNVLGPSSLVRQIYNGSFTSSGSPGCMTIERAKQNYANWYQYHRRRSFVARAAITSVVNEYPSFRFGLNVSHQVNPFLVEVPPLPAQDYTAHNQAMLRRIYSYPSKDL